MARTNLATLPLWLSVGLMGAAGEGDFTTPMKHFVVTLMENRPPDHMLGCAAREGLLPGFEGPPDHIPKDPTDPSAGVLNLTCGTAELVCECCPGQYLA